MRIILISLGLLLGSCLFAQNKTINNFYKNQRKEGNAIGMHLPGWIVQAGVNLSAEGKEAKQDLKPIRPFLRRLSSIRILTIDQEAEVAQSSINKFVKDLKKKNNFSSFLRIKEEGTKVDILVNIKERGPKKKRKSIIKNILLVVQEDQELVVMAINGRWHMGQINQLLQEEKTKELWAMP